MIYFLLILNISLLVYVIMLMSGLGALHKELAETLARMKELDRDSNGKLTAIADEIVLTPDYLRRVKEKYAKASDN